MAWQMKVTLQVHMSMLVELLLYEMRVINSKINLKNSKRFIDIVSLIFSFLSSG